jgi:hypothetical protein
VNGAKPVAMIFAREVSDNLTSLVKKIDKINSEKGNKMGSFVVFLSDKEGLDTQLKELAKNEDLKHTVLSIDNPQGPKGYDIPKDADITVVLYNKRTVQSNHAFRQGELNAESVERVLADVPMIFTEPKKKN